MAVPASPFGWEGRCIELAKKINKYLDAVAGAYDSNPEQSSLLLLTVMELWMSMDECATKFFSLLEDYNSGLPPEILDVLHLPRFQDMCRLQKIQTYLQDRHTKCKFSRMTIFDDPKKGCFAERYYDSAHQTQSFTTKPLTFLQEWLAVRRKGQDFAHTPMGYVCQGKPLSGNHPFFVRVENNGGWETDRGNGRRREGKVCGYGINDESVSDEERADDNDYGDCLRWDGGRKWDVIKMS